ncbi:hypothetical protein N7539_000958 [Penicillium diatomitis]|uniref:KAR9-domain-containing protein n=1 Tax=Penicillium diatomitis TaxID=2819901 RepID=A0A9W9XMP4_9EURO|nr:uncharacterized protein N7539_000958 [Penicillium diatomitis]KAJ5495842.1 hypothetical protein N7539_000958 [Penicillium diatomitis]
MHATINDPPPPPPATDLAPSASVSVTSASPPPSAVSASPNDPGPSPLRRLKSKSSLWSLGSSNHSAQEDDSSPADPFSADKATGKPGIFRRLSPALAARVKLLDSTAKVTSAPRDPKNVGRIPEEQLKVLDSQHKDLSIRIEKRGQAWSGPLPLSPSQQAQNTTRSASTTLDVPRMNLEAVIDAQSQGLDYTQAIVDDHSPDGCTDHPASGSLPVYDTSSAPPLDLASMSIADTEPAPAHLIMEKVPETETQPDSQHRIPSSEPSLPTETAPDTRTDFEKYVDDTKRSEERSEEQAPPPLPKDSPPVDVPVSAPEEQSYFNPMGLQRAESIYSFSRASFSNQLSQLTSIPLPQPGALQTSIENIPTALAAVRALNGAAEQIQIWIRKASDVLSGLDAEDDVEWAAAGGREGLDGVDKAITRFESLVNVYVKAIENVQLRDDIVNVGPESLTTIVSQMESILQNWAEIKTKLRGVKEQVELAMEWEELWSNVLGDVGMEIENLSGMIFEMEEKRHQALLDPGDSASGLDINELETIVEESPTKGRSPATNRLTMLAAASGTPIIKTPQDDSSYSNLMALFARMQPLRASLDFLPMRLSMFEARAERVFPSACEELDDRRTHLEKSYKVLEADAEALRKELGEDKWIIVFRNAGSQALKMFESVERSIAKLQEGLESNMHLHNPSNMTKRIENYEAKKMHYVPAIERVILIIQKGVNDRLTVNGEVLRLLSDMTSRTDALKASIRFMDESLEDVHIVKAHQLRDSISSIVTMDSPATGSVVDTPGSSPASSVVMSGSGYKTPLGSSSRRESTASNATTLSAMAKVRRLSSLPQVNAPVTGRKSSIPKPMPPVTPTPTNRRTSQIPQPSTIPKRPRWTTSTNLNDLYSNSGTSARKTPLPSRPSSTAPIRRDLSVSPIPSAGRALSRVSNRHASSSPVRNVSSPAPTHNSLLDPPPYSRLRRPSGLSATPRSRQSFAGVTQSFSRSVSSQRYGQNPEPQTSPSKPSRPGTALGHSSNRRTSLLPMPKRPDKDRAVSQSKLPTRPHWRP